MVINQFLLFICFVFSFVVSCNLDNKQPVKEYNTDNADTLKNKIAEDIVRKWWKAWETKEITVLEKLVAEDFIEYTGGDEIYRGKKTLLKTAKLVFSNLDFKATLSEINCCTYNEAVIVTYYWGEEGTYKGTPYSRKGLATDVVALKNNVWYYASHHKTEIETK
jgi:hypothetical protein